MRRFWLLLLVFVLPLQMSWAATHFCDDERLVAQTVAQAELEAHVHQTAVDEQSEAQVEKITDACCGFSHSCHSLHHLMAQPSLYQASPGSKAVVATARDTPSKCGYVATRVERPKWLAA